MSDQNGPKGDAANLLDRLTFVMFAGGAAFAAYFSMYAFRKPFTAVSYDSVGDWSFDIDFKITLVIAQVAGYALSKFIGVKVVSEMGRERRGAAIVGLISLSWLALVLFAVAPTPWKPLALLLNGLPLGMIWGLVFGYLEGRRLSDVLGAILCASFIVSSGATKSVGVWLISRFDVTELWMPAATGLVFLPLLLASIWGLSRVPPPDADDVAERMHRGPMRAADRRSFFAAYWPGLSVLVASYVLFTVIRDFRDNFAAEIWRDLGYEGVSGVFTASEAPIAGATLLLLGAIVAVRNNRRALLLINGVVLLGSAMILVSTAAFQAGALSPLSWMILAGMGLYFAYTPFNAMFFDRLVAASGQVGTAGFLIYVADASGYLGSVVVMLVRNFVPVEIEWVDFYLGLSYAGGGLALILMSSSALYFGRRLAGAARPHD